MHSSRKCQIPLQSFFFFYHHLSIPGLSEILATGYWKAWPSGWQLSALGDLSAAETLWSANLSAQLGVMKLVPRHLASSRCRGCKGKAKTCTWRRWRLYKYLIWHHIKSYVLVIKELLFQDPNQQPVSLSKNHEKSKQPSRRFPLSLLSGGRWGCWWGWWGVESQQWGQCVEATHTQAFKASHFFKCPFFELLALPHLGNCVWRNYFNIRASGGAAAVMWFQKTAARTRDDQLPKYSP